MLCRAACSAILLLAACGSDFSGTFVGTHQGQPATFVLAQDGDELTGTASYVGIHGRVAGKVDGDKASGSVTVAQYGRSMQFEARLTDDDTIEWSYPELHATLTLARQDGAPKESVAGRDPRVVGRWRRTVSLRTGVGPERPVGSFDTYCTLSADGTFEYGGAQGGVTGYGDFAGVEVGPDAVVRGEWKTEGSVLHARAEGGQWVPVGRYSVSGTAMVLYPAAGGESQFWER